jgi:magnesium transporter
MLDNFTAALDRIGVRLEDLEIQVFRKPSDAILRELLDLRTSVGYLSRSALSERDVASRIVRGEFKQLTKQALVYWYEAYDHLVRMVLMIEAHRDLINTVRDTYMSIVTNRTNEILKVMTIIATAFMPITFIAAVYGMNFRNIPEIEWRYGYLFAWGMIISVTLGMLWFFRRKRWI